MSLYMSVSFSRSRNFPAERRLRNGAKTKAGPLEAEQLSRLGFCAVCVVLDHTTTTRVDSSSEFVMSTRWNVVRLSHNTTVVHRLNPTYTCIHTIHATGLSCNIIWYIHRCCPKLPLDQSMILIKREATTVAVRPPPRQANPLRHSLAANDGDAAVRPFAVPERPLLFAVE